MNNLLFTALIIALIYYFFFYLPQQKKLAHPPLKQNRTTQTELDTKELEKVKVIDNLKEQLKEQETKLKELGKTEKAIDNLLKNIQEFNKEI